MGEKSKSWKNKFHECLDRKCQCLFIFAESMKVVNRFVLLTSLQRMGLYVV